MKVTGKKIYVGLSGGVDSAVSAALLREAGAHVTGVFIRGWYPEGMPCTWTVDRRDAMRVAARLQIPFTTLDASAEYKESVIDYLIAEYAAGRTPNPDVMCNKEVKFGAFYRYAMAEGTDAIATGHYRSGEKDQSYFLWAVPREVLEKTLFPVGYKEKTEVRALAQKFNLPVAEKKDSQGVCFLGSVSVKDFLIQELGTDNPALLHTIGERVHGSYVVGKDVAKGEITLAPSRSSTSQEIMFTHANWHGELQSVAQAQYRYRGPYIKGRIDPYSRSHLESGKGVFIADRVLPEVCAPGQSVVFYDSSGALVGGGIISQ